MQFVLLVARCIVLDCIGTLDLIYIPAAVVLDIISLFVP